MFYSAKLIFELRSLQPSGDEPLREERIVLIDASDEADAQKEALALGKEGEHEYMASDGGTVSVKFIELDRLHIINADKLEHGSELYSEYV